MIHYLSAADPKKLRGTVLLRLDFNTEDDWRMRTVLPTIKFLLKKSANSADSRKIIIVSHRGRPDGFDKKFSLRKNAATLSRWLGRRVVFLENFNFSEIKKRLNAAPDGSIFLLENLRFDPREEKNDPKFARELASLADFYVNDAFAVSHRANASVAVVTKFLPSYAGLEMEREIVSLTRAMHKPAHPLVFIAGGAKAADKLSVLKSFARKADWFLLGGGPANTILALRGMDVKKSVRDTDPRDVAAIAKFSRGADAKKILVPVDFRWHRDFIWDIGPKTATLFATKIAAARTIVWSGPLGLIERPAFARGSVAVARAVARVSAPHPMRAAKLPRSRRAFSLTGGGETVMFLKKYHLDKKFSFISTGGGAMLDFLAGKKLPGIAALENCKIAN